jgi:hypothetical protein
MGNPRSKPTLICMMRMRNCHIFKYTNHNIKPSVQHWVYLCELLWETLMATQIIIMWIAVCTKCHTEMEFRLIVAAAPNPRVGRQNVTPTGQHNERSPVLPLRGVEVPATVRTTIHFGNLGPRCYSNTGWNYSAMLWGYDRRVDLQDTVYINIFHTTFTTITIMYIVNASQAQSWHVRVPQQPPHGPRGLSPP